MKHLYPFLILLIALFSKPVTGQSIDIDLPIDTVHCLDDNLTVQPFNGTMVGYRLKIGRDVSREPSAPTEPTFIRNLVIEVQYNDNLVRSLVVPSTPPPYALVECGDNGPVNERPEIPVRISAESASQSQALAQSMRGRDDLFLSSGGEFIDFPIEPTTERPLTLKDLLSDGTAIGQADFLDQWPFTVQFVVAYGGEQDFSSILYTPQNTDRDISTTGLLEEARIRLPEEIAAHDILKYLLVSPDKCSGPSRFLPGSTNEVAVLCHDTPPFNFQLGHFNPVGLDGWTNVLTIDQFIARIPITLDGRWPRHPNNEEHFQRSATEVLSDEIVVEMFDQSHPAYRTCRVQLNISVNDLISGNAFSAKAPCIEISYCSETTPEDQQCLVGTDTSLADGSTKNGTIVLPRAAPL